MNTDLGYLNCGNNLLASLDVTVNHALTSLHCDSNQLASLDVSTKTALRYLGCGNNQLASLDVSNNTALIEIDISAMASLYEVCVWEMPSPPEGVSVFTEGSPNVYFTTIACSLFPILIRKILQ